MPSATPPRSRSIPLAASIASVLFASALPAAHAADGTWIRNSNATAPATQNWSDATNWFNGIIADGIDADAFLVYNPGSTGNDQGSNVILDTSRTIGNIFMNDLDGQNTGSVSISATDPANGSILTLDTTAGSPTIDVGFLLNNGFGGKKAIINSGLALAGTKGFTKTGLGFLSLRMVDNISGPINVLGGTLDIRVALNNDIALSGGGSLSLDYGITSAPTNEMLAATTNLTLGGATGSGFVTNTARGSTNHTQTIQSLNVNRGANSIIATNAGAGFSTTWNLGVITRTPGGALNLGVNGAGTSVFNFTPGGSVQDNDVAGIIGGWATFNGNDWATINGTEINAAGVIYANNLWDQDINTTVNAPNFPALPGENSQSNATTHSLRFNNGSARFLTLAGTNTIETGGILIGNSGNAMHQISGGSITAGTGVSDIIVHSNSSAGGWGSIIASDIVDNAGPIQFVKAGPQPLVLAGDKSFTGGTVVGQGTLVLGRDLGGSTTGSVLGNITNNGVVAFNRSGTYTPMNTFTGNGVVAQWSDGNLVLTKPVSAGGLDLRNGTTTLDFSAAGAPTSNIVPAGELTTNGFYTGGGRLTLRDATLSLIGAPGVTSVQHFALTDFQGSTSVNLTPGAGGTVALEVGAYLRPNNSAEGAGTLKLTLPAGAEFRTQASFPGAASSLVADNGQAFVTVNGTDWGAKNAANNQIVAGGTIAGFYTDLSLKLGGSNADFDENTSFGGANTLASLRFHDVAAPGTLTVEAGGQLKLGGVLVTSGAASATTIAGPGSISAANTGGRDLTVFQNSTQPLTISAVIANNSAAAADVTSLVKDGAGELILSAANTYTGRTFVQGGTLRLTGGNIGTGAAAAGNVFVREGEMVLQNNASVNTGGNYVSIGQRLGETGVLTLQGTSSWTTTGDFNVSDVNSTGTMNVQDSATANLTNLFVGKGGSSVGSVNLAGGTLAVNGGGADVRIGGNNAGDSLAQGTINQSGGSFTVNRNFQLGANGTGVYNQTGGTFTATSGWLGIGRFISGRGTWNISGGTLDVTPGGAGAALIVAEEGLGALNISGTGQVLAKNLSVGHNNGVGTVEQTGGSVVLNATNGITIGSAFQSGVVLAPQGPVSEGTYTLSGGSLSAFAVSAGAGKGVFNFNGGTLSPIASNPTFVEGLDEANVQAGGAKIDTNGFDVIIAQSLQHDPALAVADGGLTKSGEGALQLSGDSNYNGPTLVSEGTLLVSGSLTGTSALNIDGGVLELGGADRINNAATVTLSEGTLSTAGFAETLGAFTLQGTAMLDLGSGSSVLQFANSSANTWTGTLSIVNWSGLTAGGGTDQLFFGATASGLTAGQLAMIDFVNPAGFEPGTYGAAILPTGEIVAVPEPGSLVSLAGGVAMLIGFRRRRRA